MSTNSTLVRYACAARIATLSLNRPESLNSLDLATVDALISGLARTLEDDAAVLILTGTGRAFCSGADLGGALDLRDAEGRIDLGTPMRQHYNKLVQAVYVLPIPLVVAVNGIAAGGGVSLALLGDIVIAARSAAFRQTFIDIGLIPDMGATWLMPQLIGRARARGMALLGHSIDAQTAKDWGLIWDVVDDAQLMDRAQEIAAQLARRSGATLSQTRSALDRGSRSGLAEQLEVEAQIQTELGRRPAFAQAVEAFLARRGGAGPKPPKASG